MSFSTIWNASDEDFLIFTNLASTTLSSNPLFAPSFCAIVGRDGMHNVNTVTETLAAVGIGRPKIPALSALVRGNMKKNTRGSEAD